MTERGIEQQPPLPNEQEGEATVEGTREGREQAQETQEGSRDAAIAALKNKIAEVQKRWDYLDDQFNKFSSVGMRGDSAAEDEDGPRDPGFSPEEAEEYRLLTENRGAIQVEYWGSREKIDGLKAELAALMVDTGTAAEKPTDTPTEGPAVEAPKAVETVETITPQEALKAVEAMSNQVFEIGKSMGYDFALWEFRTAPIKNIQELVRRNTRNMEEIRDLRGAFDAMVAGQENMKDQIKTVDKNYNLDVGDIRMQLAKLEEGLVLRAKEFADRKVNAETILKNFASARSLTREDERSREEARRELGL